MAFFVPQAIRRSLLHWTLLGLALDLSPESVQAKSVRDAHWQDPESIAQFTRSSRLQQGLPEKVEEPSALARVATLLGTLDSTPPGTAKRSGGEGDLPPGSM